MNAEQEGLRLVDNALREGRISVDQAIYFTAQLITDGRGDADILTYRRPEIHEQRAQQQAAQEALSRHLANQERVPRKGLAAILRGRQARRGLFARTEGAR